MTDSYTELTRRSVLKNGALATGAVLVGGTAATGTAAAGIGDGRVGHYTLNNLKGKGKDKTKVHDASPEGNDGTWAGSEGPLVKGRVGNAFEFDGDSTEVIVSDSESLNPEKSLTVAAWVKATGDTSQDYNNKGVAGKWNSSQDSAQYLLWTDTSPSLDYTFSVKTEVGRADAGPVAISDSEWHHVAGVFDGKASLFVDGDETNGSSADGEIKTGSTPFKIGNYATGKHFAGHIDEVRVYDRVLSQSEIKELASMGED